MQSRRRWKPGNGRRQLCLLVDSGHACLYIPMCNTVTILQPQHKLQNAIDPCQHDRLFEQPFSFQAESQHPKVNDGAPARALGAASLPHICQVGPHIGDPQK